MDLLTPSENERYGIAHFKRELGEIVVSKTSVRVYLHIKMLRLIKRDSHCVSIGFAKYFYVFLRFGREPEIGF